MSWSLTGVKGLKQGHTKIPRVIFQVKFNPYLSCKINVGSILE